MFLQLPNLLQWPHLLVFAMFLWPLSQVIPLINVFGSPSGGCTCMVFQYSAITYSEKLHIVMFPGLLEGVMIIQFNIFCLS